MKALVTGSTGFLGKNIVYQLARRGIQSVNWTSNNVDLTDYENIARQDIGIVDRIYHTAVSYKDNNASARMNYNMIKFWYKNQCNAHFITYGTSCSYPEEYESKSENYLRGNPENEYSEYAYTKRKMLTTLKKISKYNDAKFTYMIPCSMYGPRYKVNDTHLIPDLIRKAYEYKTNGKPIVLRGDGTQVRQLIHVKDAAKISIDLYDKDEVLNLCHEKYRVIEIAKHICEIMDIDSNVIMHDDIKRHGVHKRVMHPSLLIDWTPLRQGLTETIQSFLESK